MLTENMPFDRVFKFKEQAGRKSVANVCSRHEQRCERSQAIPDVDVHLDRPDGALIHPETFTDAGGSQQAPPAKAGLQNAVNHTHSTPASLVMHRSP